MAKRIALIGGGTSGLSAAYALQKKKSAGTALDYVLFEAGQYFGGVIRTEHIDDCVVEAGPDSFLTEKPWAADLCRELGLGDQLIASNDAERKTYILVTAPGAHSRRPDVHGADKTCSGVFCLYVLVDHKATNGSRMAFAATRQDSEMTVAEFVQRHYGREMVDRVADPLLAGVYGGSAEGLSVHAVLPRFAEMEAKYGSLGRAMVAARKNASAGGPRPLFTSLKNGMQQMTDALISRLPAAALRPDTRVEAVKAESGKWLVVSERPHRRVRRSDPGDTRACGCRFADRIRARTCRRTCRNSLHILDDGGSRL